MLLTGRTLPLAIAGARGRRASPARVLCSTASSDSSAEAPSSAMTVPQEARKLRILCLHGYLQNAEIFRTRIGSMRKALRSRAEFIFVDAPYAAEGASAQDADDSAGSAAEGRTWWQWEDLEPGTRPSRAARYTGWEASQEALAAALAEHHPIDGLLGFSQGATAAALFLAHRIQPVNAEKDASRLFAVLIGGFLPRDQGYAGAIKAAAPLGVRSLHVSGEKDALVPTERSAELWEAFDPGQRSVLRHPGAHMVPTCSGSTKAAFVEFLDGVKAAAGEEGKGEGGGAVEAAGGAEPAAVLR